MELDMVSTGQAAKLCAVTPDTILKWIKNDKLKAVKTAGGHFRIPKSNLTPYMNKGADSSPIITQQINYCWEYHAKNEEVIENCRGCTIFKLKAEKCFLIAGSGKDKGHANTFCQESCHDCEYFHFLNKIPINILIITENQLFRQNVNATYLIEMNFKFSCCGYETSSIIQQFHPDYIIIDESMVNSSSDEICKHLLKDPRAHGSQIILAVSEYQISKKLPEGVCASIRVPFYDSDMEECIRNLRNEFFGQNEIRQNSDSNNLK